MTFNSESFLRVNFHEHDRCRADNRFYPTSRVTGPASRVTGPTSRVTGPAARVTGPAARVFLCSESV
jgi:hypothetical protein